MYPINDFIILPENIKTCSECGDQIFVRKGSAPICDRCWNKVKPKEIHRHLYKPIGKDILGIYMACKCGDGHIVTESGRIIKYDSA